MITSVAVDIVSEETPFWIRNIKTFQYPITFQKGLNLVIGLNASGKTTLLKIISNKYPNLKKSLNSQGDIVAEYFTTNIGGYSSGENMVVQFIEFSNKIRSFDTFILDEPDRGLDFKFQRTIVKRILEMVEYGKQMIVSTNSLYLFALLKRHAHIIEMTEGYTKVLDDAIDEMTNEKNKRDEV